MGTTITFTTPLVTITITGDTPFATCTYDRLVDWYGIDDVDLNLEKRPNARGAYAPQQTYPGEKVISVEGGQYFGATRAAALAMREDLSMLYNEGRPITMTVTDDLRTTSREVLVAAVNFPWTIHPEFDFSIDVVARDTARYATEVASSTGLALPGTGLTWPIVWPIDWGTIGVNGRIVITNPGNASTFSRFVVTGDMPDGFVVVNATTAQRLTYLGAVNASNIVTLDSELRAAFINDTSPGSRWLSAPDWWIVPPRSSIEIAFVARGATSGTPTLTAYTKPAYY